MTGSREKIDTGPVRRPWRFDLTLDHDSNVSRQTQLSRALVREIQRGRLPPGSVLPGSRTLAAQLGVNRKVVVAAVDELVSQGWLETVRATGTKVASSLPQLPVADVELPPPAAVGSLRRADALVSITDGMPDVRLAPFAELSRAYARALRAVSRGGSGYGDPAGDMRLREVLAAFVSQARGLSTRSDDVFLTRGSQGALALYALAMLAPGDVVAAETPGYAPAWRAFAFAGAEVAHVPIDHGGLRTDLLERAARRLGSRLKAVYVTPHHQYPTSVSMAPERRMALLQLAERYGFTILEDDYDYEYHFDGEPLLPLHATAGGQHVVYIASLSKLLAPSIRLGYLVAPPSCAEALRDTRTVLERQGDVVLERAIAELFEDGTIQRHARRARRVYRARRDHLLEALADSPSLRGALACEVPGGGLALWLRLRHGRVDELVVRARALRIALTPGSAHLPRGALDAVRFGFAAHSEAELTQLCKKLARCVAS